MATEREIERLVNLRLQMLGVAATKSRIRDVVKELQKLEKIFPGISKDTESVSKVVNHLANTYKKAEKEAAKAFNEQSRGAAKAKQSVDRLDRSVKSFAKSLALMFGIGGGGPLLIIQQATNRLTGFNKEMIDGASKAARFGISISEVENMVKKVSTQTSLTRQETLKLFQAYESGFRIMSQAGFEKIAANIRKVTGPNAEAMNAMLQQISGVVDKLPELQSAFENLDASGKQRIKRNVELMAMAGRISQAELKAVQRYLAGSEQMSDADKKRMAQTIRQQAVMKQFSQSWEKVQLSLAETFLPLVEQISNFLDANAPKIEEFFQNIVDQVKWVVAAAQPAFDWATNNFGTLTKGILLAVAAMTSLNLAFKAFSVYSAMKMSFGLGLGGQAANAGANAATGRGGAMMAGLAARGKGALKLTPWTLAAAAGSIGLEYGADKLRDAGYTKSAGAAEAGSGALGIAGWTLAGTTIGTLIAPGIGTAIGGALGALGGVISNWEQVADGIAEMWTGKTQEERANVAADAESVRILAGAAQQLPRDLDNVLSYAMTGAEKKATVEEEYEKALSHGSAMGIQSSGVPAPIANWLGGIIGGYGVKTEKVQGYINADLDRQRAAAPEPKNYSEIVGEQLAVRSGKAEAKKKDEDARAARREASIRAVEADYFFGANQYGIYGGTKDYGQAAEDATKTYEELYKQQQEKMKGFGFQTKFTEMDVKTGKKIETAIQGGITDESIAASEKKAEDLRSLAKDLRSQAAVAVRRAKDEGMPVDTDQIRSIQANASNAEAQADAYDKLVTKSRQMKEEEEKRNVALQEAKIAMADANAQANQALILEDRRKKIADALKQASQVQLGILGSIVERSVKIGDVSRGTVEAGVQAYNEALDKQIVATQSVINKLEQQKSKEEIIHDIKKDATLTEEQRAIEIAKAEALTVEEIESGNALKTLYGELQKATVERRLSVLKVVDAMQGQVDVLSSQAGVYTSLVNLADNFALGVGASVAMRKQAADALQREVDYERERLSLLGKAMDADPHNLEIQKRYYDTEKKILGLQQQQAGLLKSTRDGWIRAIGAMNTGAGRFTKIMISQEQNMEAGLRNVEGMLTSFTSGSIGAGGYRGSSRFAGMGGGIVGEGFASLGGSAGVTAREPYGVSVDATAGMIDMAVGLREQVQQGINSMQARANRAGAGGGPVFASSPGQMSQLQAEVNRGGGVTSFSSSPRSASSGFNRGMGSPVVQRGAGRSTGEINVYTTIKYGEWGKLANAVKKAVSEAEGDMDSFATELARRRVNPGE